MGADRSGEPGARTDDLRTIERSVRIAAPPEVVFDFLTDRKLLPRWMGFAAEVDPRPGGVYRCSVVRRDLFVEGEFVEVDPPRRVVFTWGWDGSDDLVPPGSTTVEFTLTDEAGETLLTLRHSGLPEGHDAFHGVGWDVFLPRLGEAATGGDPGALAPERLAGALAHLPGHPKG